MSRKDEADKGRANKFLAEYYHDGSWWGIHFFAVDFADAEVVCKAHSLKLIGRHKMTIPAVAGAWLPNLIIRAQGLFE